MDKIKVAFLIHDLGQGGAEKVLVNLVNNMNSEKFDITLIALFGGGVNEQFISPNVRFKVWFSRMIPGNSKIMKLFSPKQLYKLCIKEQYDIVVSYLEGPTARLVSGCNNEYTKLVSWIHVEMLTEHIAAASFRSMKEADRCYKRFDKTICVSQTVKSNFSEYFNLRIQPIVLYNTVESEKIIMQSQEPIAEQFNDKEINLIGVGTLKQVKGFHRLIKIQKRLRDENLPVHLYILGRGPERDNLEQLAVKLGIEEYVTFLGYQTNPYKYIAKSDLFLCASRAEGFSTATTEALIVGTPVCTVEVSGMKEMLGDNDEYGIVTDNDDEALYQGIYDLLTVPGKLDFYKERAFIRGKDFQTEKTVKAVEDMLMTLYSGT